MTQETEMTLHPVPSQETLNKIAAEGYTDFVAGEDDCPYDEYTQPFHARAWHDGYRKADASDEAWAEREKIRLANDPDSDYSELDIDEEDEL
jgi:ribosome modulation factor